MAKAQKGGMWSINADIDAVAAAPGVKRKVLSYCDELMCVENHFEKGAVGAMHSHPHTQMTYIAQGSFEFTIGDETKVVNKGDVLLKQHGIVHGCVCLEKGILADFFTPIREDFID